jgi:excisionase family DNA binding protein
MRQMFDIKKAAELTGLSVSWWRKAVQGRTVPFVRIGRRILIEESAINQLLDQSRVEPWGALLEVEKRPIVK